MKTLISNFSRKKDRVAKALFFMAVPFIMLGCSDNLSTQNVSGYVVDGYIANATVCIDLNTNETCDVGEPTTSADANGSYTLETTLVGDGYTVLAYGGTDTATGELQTQPYKAIVSIQKDTPVRKNITPLTSVVHELYLSKTKENPNYTYEDAKNELATALEISADDVESDPMQNNTLFAKTQRIVQTSSLLSSIVDQNGTDTGFIIRSVALTPIAYLASELDITISTQLQNALESLEQDLLDALASTDAAQTRAELQKQISENIKQLNEKIQDGEEYVLGSLFLVQTPAEPTTNSQPTISTTFSDINLVENSGTTNYEINISDADGDSLTLSVESNDTSIITVTPNYTSPVNQATYATALDFNLTTQSDTTGSAKITITVDDGESNATTSFDVDVVTVLFKGLVYNKVISPFTGKKWLDRNLGATQVCTALNDTDCYGDYYQWGRNADGHEKSDSNTTEVKDIDINNAGTDFIISSPPSANDWTGHDLDGYIVDSNGSQRVANWSKTDGTSVCPVGYRVPTIDELAAERTDANITNNTTAFSSFLKLPSAGFRFYDSGSMSSQNTNGYVWSSSVNGSDSRYLYFNNVQADTAQYYRSFGFSVRCIANTPPTANAGVDQNVTVSNSVTLDGSGSSDVEGSVLTYSWSIASKPSGSNTTLSSSTVVSPSFTPDVEGTYILSLVVNDGLVDSSEDNVTISVGLTHNGVYYGVVTSPDTNRTWLDRNLGASQVCTALNDTACYGDYYQWGRDADGHQESNSTTTATLATDINSAGTDFITDSYPYDWAVSGIDDNGSLRSANWSKTDGSSVCPLGYRVPTLKEIEDETTLASTKVNNNTDAFNNFLKLPSAGYRTSNDGNMFNEGSSARLWSSTVINSQAYILLFSSSTYDSQDNISNGDSVRCIKD